MWTRRQFGQQLGAAAAAATLTPGRARAAPIKMRCGLASGVNDAQVSFQTVPGHPRLGWYQEENVEVEIVNTTSTSQPMQMLSGGQVEFATIAPTLLIPVFADNPAMNVICAYTWMPRIHNGVVVKPDSPIQTIAELKGKTIGIRNTGDSGYPFMQAMLRELGIDPQKDVEWVAVGAGGPAGQALYKDAVQALAIWDVEFVRIGIAGFKLRQLPNLPSTAELFGNAYAVNVAAFEKNRDAYVRTFRAIAKGQIFVATNPRAAIRLHWDLYPESKAKGKTDEESMNEMLKIIETRRDKWFPLPANPDQRMGAVMPRQWEAALRFVASINPRIEGKIKDVSKLYTDAIIGEVNRFDRAAIEAQARDFKI